MYEKDGRVVSLEDAQAAAKRLNLSLEQWLNKTGYTQAGEGKPSEPLVTAPLVGPVPQRPAGESRSGDISLEQQEPELARFVQIGGRTFYEDDYLKNYAGKKTGRGNYPDTFEEYAKLQKAEIQTESIAQPLEEVTVTAEAPTEIKELRQKAEDFDKELANVNEFSERINIATDYFSLEEREDGSFFPKVEREQYFPDLPGGRKSGWAEYKNDFETDLRNSLGWEKYKKWKTLERESGGKVTADKIKEFYNDIGIDQQVAQGRVQQAKVKKAEILSRDLTEEEQSAIQRFRGDEDLQAKKQEKYVAAVEDERAYKEKTGRELITPQTVDGRTYTPTSYVDYSDIIEVERNKITQEFESIDNQNKEIESNWNELLSLRDSFEDQIANIDAQIKQFDVNAYSPQGEIDKYNALIEQRNAIIESESFETFTSRWESLASETEAFKTRISDALEKNKSLLDQQIGQEAALKSYDALTRLAITWEEFTVGSFMGLVSAVGELGSDLYSNPKLATYNPALAYQFEQSKRVAVDYNKRLADKRNRTLPQSLTYSDLKGDASGWDYFSEGLINNSPSIVLAMAPSSVAGIGLTGVARMRAVHNAGKLVGGVFGVAEAGGYIRETDLALADAEKNIINLQEQLANVEGTVDRNNILAQIQEQEELLDLSSMQKAFNAAAYGTIAMYAERLGSLGVLSDFNKYSKNIGYDQLLKISGGKERLAKTISANLGTAKASITGVAIEEFEEIATQVGQNLMDITVGQQDKSLIEGLDPDFFLNVAISSFAMTGPSVGSNVYNSLASEFRTSKDIKQNAELTEELLNIQGKLDSDQITADERKALRFKRRALLQTLAISDAQQLMKVKQLNKQELMEVAEIQRKKRAIKKEAEALGFGEVDPSTRQELDRLTASYNELEARREDILGKPDRMAKDATKDSKNPVEAAFNYKNYLFNLEVAQAVGKDITVIYGEQDIDNLNLSEEQRAKIKQAWGTSEQVGANAMILDDGKIIVFEDNIQQTINNGGVEASIAAVSPLHEIGHRQAAAAGIIKDGKLVGSAKTVIDGIYNEVNNLARLGKITDAQLANFNARIDAYKTDEGVDVDELIQLIADFTNSGILPKSSFTKLYEIKSFVNNAIKFFNPGASLFFEVNTADDVFNFVSSWTTKAMQGRMMQMPPEELQDTKESKALLDEINALVPENIETQEQFFARSVFNPIYNNGQLHPAIANYIRSRSTSKEEAQKIIESVADRLINFNPAAKRKSGDAKITLGEFIFSNVNFGKLDARKALFEESQERAQTESVDAKEARQITAQEADITQTEKPTYKSLLQRRVVDEEVINNAKAKVLSSIRVLKSRIDAPVSKNVTVTPIIAEIKKTFGKQLDIDIKKAMGGIKDGELRKYLLRNKAAILENMTTTWLMTAMPNAVQKQVGGVWTSDWKGKKIDREKVSTDNAGRTSGAELVRRLPKAATRMPDADYLSNFFNPDGSLIRGRKESLAKAIGEELGIEIVKESLQDLNSEIAQAFIANQERQGVDVTEGIVPEFNRQAERGNVKFSQNIQQLQRIGLNIRSKFDLELPGNRDKAINKVLANFNIDKVYELKTKEDIDAWAEATKKYVIPLLPKWYWFAQSKDGTYKESKNSAFRRSSRFVGDKSLDGYFVSKINEIRALDESAFGKDPGVGKKVSSSYDTNIGTNDAKMQENIDNGNVAAFNDYHTKMHAAFWSNVNKVLKQNKNNPDAARAIGHYLSLVSNDTSHVHKMGAAFVGYSIDAKGKTSKEGTFKKYEWEHAMPATNAYVYLMDAALNGFDFDAAYSAVMSNYKLIALDAAQDLKIKAAGLSNGMPEGWSVIDNDWWERYSASGVDLSTIKMTNGQTLNEAAGVDASGNYLSQNAIAFNKGINTEQLNKAKQEIKELESAKMSTTLDAAQRKELNDEFNNILERKTGVEAFKTFSKVQAQMRGAKKGRFKFFVAPNVDDFRGLVNYAFAGKGKQGDIDKAWLEEKLMTPYAKGTAAIDGIRQQIKRDFREVVKAFPQQYKMLNTQIANSGFTYDQAVRVYLWKQAGITPPGLSKKDMKLLDDAIKANPELTELANALLVVARRDQWMDPSEHWIAGTVLSDLNGMTEKIGRKKYLAEFIENAEIIFSEDNLNKIEALFGKNHREAIEDALYSMKNGTNRTAGSQNKTVNAWLNWINGSTGAIMFFNRRSSLLQMLSFTNFINWSDNNPIKAAAAFANQKQYWTDWVMIFNSDKLKERRGGLKQDVSSDEIASVANQSKNSPQAILAYLLKIGFTPTQIADSMAIATGGAMFYRNRVNTYLKQGMDQKAAEEQAFIDFAKKSDEAQQSSDPALVSQLQRSVMGRLVFAFQNTPMQYTRLMKKAALDLANGRGDWKENVSKIAYYGAVQNFIFSALQSALFSMLPGFDDDEEGLSDEELAKLNAREEQKITNVLNSMLDTLLKGSGVYGAIAATVKNIIRKYMEQEEKGFLGDHAYTVLSLFDVSPPIGSKARKVYSAIQTRRFDKDEIEARGWGVTADGKLNLGPNWSILGKVLSASANVPLDRVVDELTSISEAFDARNKAWQRIALGLGWKTWDVGAVDEEGEAIKEEAKAKRKKEGIEKAKKTREETKKKKEEAYEKLSPLEKAKLKRQKAEERRRKKMNK